MHLKHSNANIVSANEFCNDFSRNNEARVRVLYNVSKQQISAWPGPKSVARYCFNYFLHTSNEKHHFFIFKREFRRFLNIFGPEALKR